MPDASRVLIYVDTSAIVKLLFSEAESEALRRWLTDASPSLVSSALLEVELTRAVIRARSLGVTAVSDAAVNAVLDSVDLVDLDAEQLRVASRLNDAYLRALDAIHGAAALTVGARLAGILTYDVRMIQAAQARSIALIAPA